MVELRGRRESEIESARAREKEQAEVIRGLEFDLKVTKRHLESVQQTDGQHEMERILKESARERLRLSQERGELAEVQRSVSETALELAAAAKSGTVDASFCMGKAALLAHLQSRMQRTPIDTALASTRPTYEDQNPIAPTAASAPVTRPAGLEPWLSHGSRAARPTSSRDRTPPRASTPTGSPFVDSLLASDDAMRGSEGATVALNIVQGVMHAQQQHSRPANRNSGSIPATTPDRTPSRTRTRRSPEERTRLEMDLQERIVGKLKKHLSGDALERQIELHTRPREEASQMAWAAASRDSFRSMSPLKASPAKGAASSMRSFDALDQNKDGVVDRQEWQAAAALVAGPMSRGELASPAAAHSARERAAELRRTERG